MNIYFCLLETEWHYPSGDTEDGWGGTCSAGMKQSPINIDTNVTATIHAPIKYKNYFINGGAHSKVCKDISIFYCVLFTATSNGLYNRNSYGFFSFSVVQRDIGKQRTFE